VPDLRSRSDLNFNPGLDSGAWSQRIHECGKAEGLSGGIGLIPCPDGIVGILAAGMVMVPRMIMRFRY